MTLNNEDWTQQYLYYIQWLPLLITVMKFVSHKGRRLV
jgi:hypothetical protein